MLYLRTGSNGSCKTLFTLADVRKLQVESGRPVVHNGRFKIKPEKEQEFGWRRIEFKDWQAEQDGTIFLIDECHNDMPNRPTGSVVPDHVRMLAEHRARGFDFFLLTQHPMNIDAFVRKLVGAPGWHQHLKRVFGGTGATRVLQWDAVNPQCEKDGSGKTAQITTRVQPKEVFEWYDSATIHTAKTRIPMQVWVLGAAALIIPTMGYFAWQYVKPGGKMLGPASSSGAPGAPGLAPSSSGPAPERAKPRTVQEYVADYRPRLAGLMHTAPAYDKLTEPKRVPVAAACIQSAAKGCKCFTQDATPYPVDEAMCRALVQHGAFYAFKAEGEGSVRPEPQKVVLGPSSAVAEPDRGVGLSIIGALPSAGPAAPEPAPPPPSNPNPQRIAVAKR